MMLSRAFIGPWGDASVKAFAYGRGLAPRGLGITAVPGQSFTDTPDITSFVQPADPSALLAKAKAQMLAAGYAGAECRTETVYYPNGGGGSYTQDICSAPGYTGGSEAQLIAAMTPQQLAAQRSMELVSGEGNNASYFQMTAGAPNISVSNSTAGGAPASVTPDWFNTLTTKMNTAPPAAAAAPQQQAASQVSTAAVTGSGSTVPLLAGLPATVGGVDTTTLLLVGGAALALFMVMGRGR